jgi:small neutral amino acid transporter SnatA (MarC family)
MRKTRRTVGIDRARGGDVKIGSLADETDIGLSPQQTPQLCGPGLLTTRVSNGGSEEVEFFAFTLAFAFAFPFALSNVGKVGTRA